MTRVHTNFHQRHPTLPGYWVEPAVCLPSTEAATDYQHAADKAEPEAAKWREWRVWPCDPELCPRAQPR
jgi:hypothetical protein